jgi:hypothetical protein
VEWESCEDQTVKHFIRKGGIAFAKFWRVVFYPLNTRHEEEEEEKDNSYRITTKIVQITYILYEHYSYVIAMLYTYTE